MRGLFIAGTDTDVGKTVLTGGLNLALKEKGFDTFPIKPMASGCVEKDGMLISEDAVFLAHTAQVDPHLVCPYLLKEPLAPYPAAKLEAKEIDPQATLDYFQSLDKEKIYLVEGIGGIEVPITKDYFVSHLIQDLDLPTLIVGRTGLGTINHTVLTYQALKQRGVEVIGFVLNGLSDNPTIAEKTNPSVIQDMTGLPCLGVLPHLKSLNYENLKKAILEYFDLDKIQDAFIRNAAL